MPENTLPDNSNYSKDITRPKNIRVKRKNDSSVNVNSQGSNPQPKETWIEWFERNWDEFWKLEKRRPFIAIVLLIAVIAIISIGIGGKDWAINFLKSPGSKLIKGGFHVQKRDCPFNIAVFYPNPRGDRAANKDGVVQKAGFDEAFEMFDGGVKDTHVYEYEFDVQSKEEFVKPILEKMKILYSEHDVRVFILTMDSASLRIRSDFSAWRDSIENNNEKPLLICTVASAPNIADLKSGILRFYIRSEEESVELARYGFWAKHVTKAAVFFITKEQKKRNDPYGEKSCELFVDEFTALGGKIVGTFEIDHGGRPAPEKVAELIGSSNDSNTAVFVVGYGTMFKATLEELLRQKFAGVILCASTVTEEDWRPKGLELFPTATIEPLRRKGARAPSEFEKNVVRFFAYQTLLKALECAKDARSTPEFIRYWQKESEGGVADILDVESLANGDTVVKIRAVDFKL
jgi:hypothetical protein